MKTDYLYKILLISGVCGYFFVASISAVFGFNSSLISFAIRALTAVVACILIFRAIGSSGNRFDSVMILSLILFWIVYGLRILNDTFLENSPLSQEPIFYWMWGFGASALPMLALAINRISNRNSIKPFILIYCLLLISGLFALFGASTMAESSTANDIVDTGRLRLDALNPISMGHLGATLAIQSIWAFIGLKLKIRGWKSLLVILGLFTGLYLLVASNSRGPLVSFFICLLFSVFLASGRSRNIGFISLIVFGLAFVPAIIYLEENFNITTYSRLFGQSQIDEVSSQTRIHAYQSAINDFLDNPILGSGIEDRSTGFYPHNVIIESFMATGLLGGSLFVVIISFALYFAINIYINTPVMGWASLFFIQYFVGAQFSGSLCTSTYFWIGIGLLVSICGRARLHRA